MILIPAVDIKNNNCVRLKRGNSKDFKIFSKNPLLVINKWINLNFKRLHIVDLDGALKGKPKNLLIIKNLLKFLNNKAKIQIGGGIRSLDIIDYYFDIGVSYVILGTKAIIDVDFFKFVCEKYKNKVILSIDLKNFKIAINGWKSYYDLNIFKFLKKISNYNFESAMYTDIKRDGMLNGLNVENFLKISKHIDKPLIIGGGLSTIKDIKTIFSIKKKLLGIICGTSIYTGKLNLNNVNNKINYFNNNFLNYF
ncbi:MAG: HisA/HisF-related TIM barrel protein [Candidatus Nasuia deltocephalinicola]